MNQLLEEAKKLIRINSVTKMGNEEIANYVAMLMQDRGLKVTLQHVTHSLEDVSKRQFNVIGVLGDPLVDKKTKKGLMLNTHLDTVSPGLSENWTETGNDPFNATIKNGKIFGLGTADVKLDFLCKLYAIDRFRDRKLKMPIYLVGSCGEEMGMFGTKYLIKSLALNPKYVVVGEPSELEVVYAHKCYMIYRVSIGFQQIERDAKGFNRRIDLHSFGRSGHGSYPDMGLNAILQAFDFLKYASDNGFEMRFTSIEGGDTVNKVPDKSFTEFYLTSHQFEDFKRFFREYVRSEGKEKSFRVELGGIGDMGVKFLPHNIFSCVSEITDFFRNLADELRVHEDDSYNPAYSTVNIGKIQPKLGALDLMIDMRLLPQLKLEEIEDKIQKGIKKIALKYPNLNVSGQKDRVNPSLNMSFDSPLVKYCKDAFAEAELPEKFQKKSTSTEASQFFQAGFEAVVFGPGLSHGNSHSPNEYNLLEHLEKAVNFYDKLIERIVT